MLPDSGDLGAGVATPERHLLSGGGPAAGGNDLPVTLDSLLQRGDLAGAHERDVDAVGRAQPIVEIGPHLLPARLLLGRDRAAVGEAAIRVERVLGESRRRDQRSQQGRRDGLGRKTRRGAPSC